MHELQERIRREGKVLPGNIIKVDGFLNHRVDTKLMEHIAEEFQKYFDTSDITMVLTAEASGIALATVCAQKFGVPMVFAKKAKSDNIEGGLYQSEIFSYTYKKKMTLIVSKEWLGPEDKVLIIDDFMAKGNAMQGLIDLVNEAGATLKGIGVAVEKGFQGGGDRFRGIPGVPYKALAVIESAEPGNIVLPGGGLRRHTAPPFASVCIEETPRRHRKGGCRYEKTALPRSVPGAVVGPRRLHAGGAKRRQARHLPLSGGGDGGHRLPGLRGDAHLHLPRHLGGERLDRHRLTVTPQPDSVLRVFLAWKGLEKEVDIPPQELPAFQRRGFTLVEWGGTEIPK